MSTLAVFDGWNLDITDRDEPRARDVDIAEHAGLAEPRDVRRTIDKNWDLLTPHGEIRVCGRHPQTSGGRPATEYWLNEAQSVALVSLLKTPTARALHVAMVQLFVAYRRGRLVEPLPLDIAHGIRLRDEPRLKGEMQALCGMTARATGRTLQSIYGFVRKTYRVGSPFDVAAQAWPAVKATLESIALGKLLLPGKGGLLRLVDKRPASLPLPFSTG